MFSYFYQSSLFKNQIHQTGFGHCELKSVPFGQNNLPRRKLSPYHPQGRGKIERFNRRIKEKVYLQVYCSPEELKKAIDEAMVVYNDTPHESLKNVSPNDVYAGKKEVILQNRKEKKRLTMERRRLYNLYGWNINTASDQHQSANLL